jgi:hypothetical protein
LLSAPLLRTDEVLELHRIPHKEDRGVVGDHVEVALLGVELEREPPRITPGVWAAAFARNGGEPREHLAALAGLERVGLGVGADVVGDIETPESAPAFSVWLPLDDPFPIELGHVLDEVVIVQQDRPVRSHGEGMVVAWHRYSGICSGVILLGHSRTCSRPTLTCADEYPLTCGRT